MTTRKTAAPDVPVDDTSTDVPMFDVPPADVPPGDAAPKQASKARRSLLGRDHHHHEPPPAKKGPGRPPKATSYATLRKDVQDTIDKLCAGLAVMSLVSPKLAYDVAIIGGQSEALSKELVRLAETTPWLERSLRAMVSAKDSSAALMLIATIAVPILANHGVLPGEVATLVGAPMPPAEGEPSGLGDLLAGAFATS